MVGGALFKRIEEDKGLGGWALAPRRGIRTVGIPESTRSGSYQSRPPPQLHPGCVHVLSNLTSPASPWRKTRETPCIAEKSASGWGHPCAPGMVLDMSNAYLVTEGAYPDPKGRAIDVMTAHDPGGRIASDPANASAEAWLAVELERRGLTRWPAAGGNSSWTHVEPGAAVVGTEEADAVALCADFGQEAIFVLTPADRRVVGCADRRVVATGWSVEPDPMLNVSRMPRNCPRALDCQGIRGV